ncbi:MAG: glycosyltransferase [Bryobacteraceae bacterium]
MLRLARRRAKPTVITLADQARDQGQWERAIGYYQVALRRNPHNPPIWVQYGHVLKESGDVENAERAYRTALAYDPRNADTHAQLGHVLKMQDKKGEARAAYLKAVALDSSLDGLSVEFGSFGWSEAHISQLRDMLAAGADEPKAASSAFRALPDHHINGDGSDPFPRRHDPPLFRFGRWHRRPSQITLADQARDAGKWGLAAQYYRAALDRNPQNAPIWVQYGHVLKEAGNLAEAEGAYRSAITFRPGDADSHLQLGHLLKLRGKLEDAQASYISAYSIEPSLPSALAELTAFGWSAEKLAELHGHPSGMGSQSGSHNGRAPIADYPEGNPQGAAARSRDSIDGTGQEEKGASAQRILGPATLLFAGSIFSELSVTSGAEAAKIIAKSATPAAQLSRYNADEYSPKISIILPIYDTPAGYFREVTQSIFSQTYTNWEMCVVDDGSRRGETITIRKELEQSSDLRIKVTALPENRGIAAASQEALQMATGDYVAFVDHDDLLTPNALSEVVSLLREDPAVDYVYTDHAMADRDGLPISVSSKPEWSPEFLLSTNYIVHFKVVRRDLLLSVGGLAHELSHVQDLGMSWRLVEANARIAHLQKPVYLWREHENSVASTSKAKPGIEELLVDVYDRHLRHVDALASQTWPQPFRRGRVGVFRLDFEKVKVPTSLIVFMKSDAERPEEIRKRIGNDIADRVDLHFISLGDHIGNDKDVLILPGDLKLNEFLSSLNSEFIVFVNSTAQFITPKWFDDLVGYLTLDQRIGAVGGKVLDEYLRVRAGGLLVDRNGNYKTICGGEFDNNPGHWWIGQVASNVDAVSAQLLATRVNVLLSSGGVRLQDYEDAWSVAFSHHLRKNDFRLVYNPFAKIFDPGRVYISKEARDRIARVGQAASAKRYYAAL